MSMPDNTDHVTDPVSTGKMELVFGGTDNNELRFTLWESSDGGFVANFVIVDHEFPDLASEMIDIPLETLMPLVLSLGGSIARYIAKDKS